MVEKRSREALTPRLQHRRECAGIERRSQSSKRWMTPRPAIPALIARRLPHRAAPRAGRANEGSIEEQFATLAELRWLRGIAPKKFARGTRRYIKARVGQEACWRL
jgi:hypothetical protein